MSRWIQASGQSRFTTVTDHLCVLQACVSTSPAAGRVFSGMVLLLLLYFRLTSFHLESVSVAFLLSQECSSQNGDSQPIEGGERAIIVKGKKLQKHFADNHLLPVSSISQQNLSLLLIYVVSRVSYCIFMLMWKHEVQFNDFPVRVVH